MKSKSKPNPSFSAKPMSTEQQFEAMCRHVEKVLLSHGATPTEVALLRQYSGDHCMTAVIISIMQIRIGDARPACAQNPGCRVALVGTLPV